MDRYVFTVYCELTYVSISEDEVISRLESIPFNKQINPSMRELTDNEIEDAPPIIQLIIKLKTKDDKLSCYQLLSNLPNIRIIRFQDEKTRGLKGFFLSTTSHFAITAGLIVLFTIIGHNVIVLIHDWISHHPIDDLRIYSTILSALVGGAIAYCLEVINFMREID